MICAVSFPLWQVGSLILIGSACFSINRCFYIISIENYKIKFLLFYIKSPWRYISLHFVVYLLIFGPENLSWSSVSPDMESDTHNIPMNMTSLTLLSLMMPWKSWQLKEEECIFYLEENCTKNIGMHCFREVSISISWIDHLFMPKALIQTGPFKVFKIY